MSTHTFIPRRSVLYMPASNNRALEKAKSLEADCLIFDLEDAVAPAEKITARQQACAAVRAGGYGRREVCIRINSLASAWGKDDLAAVLDSGAAAVVLPKVESADEIIAVAQQIPAACVMAIWAMIETPRGVQHVEHIAAAHPRLRVLVMGTSDLAKELRIPHTADRLGFIYALSRCVLAARAAGIEIIDGVQLDLDDETALRGACEQGRTLGFEGKSLIHPKQIAVANDIFSPSAAAIADAQQVISAWETAKQQGSGVAVVNGKLVENLHVAEAQRILVMAQALARGAPQTSG
jgi:citrate lyase subunit beta/citryl-CoA lyase